MGAQLSLSNPILHRAGVTLAGPGQLVTGPVFEPWADGLLSATLQQSLAENLYVPGLGLDPSSRGKITESSWMKKA